MQSKKAGSLHLKRRFVSEIELEQVTGVSRRTWQKHRLLKRGPRYYRIYGSIRYDLEEVVAWIKTSPRSATDHYLIGHAKVAE